MQSISLINSSSSTIFHPFAASDGRGRKGRASSFVGPIKASRYSGAADQNFGGRTVDESMIVLRKRIHEMNMIERNYEPPSDWMEWEKRYYTSYDSIICDAMGVLQTHLMNTRPSVALGVIALVAVSVPTSTAVVLLHLQELAKAVLAGIH